MINVSLFPSPRKGKAWRMVFTRPKDGTTTHTDFGSTLQNYTQHHDDMRKQRFLTRFRRLIEQDKANFMKPITLSTMILWNKPTIEESFQDYLKHFKLKGTMKGEGIKFFTRWGGKTLVAKDIIKMFPQDYSTYIEPFLGGGKVFLELEKKPEVQYILNDKNKDIYYLWKDMQTISPEVVKQFEFPQSKEMFEELKNKTNIKNKKERLYRNLYLSFFSYSGNRMGYAKKRATRGKHILQSIEKLQQQLKGVKILNQDYKKVIEKYDNPDAVIYLDPPYYMLEKYYEGQAIQLDELVEVCRKIKGKFILSYNMVPEVRKAFKEFNIRKIELVYTSSHKLKRYKKNEYLITNF